MNVFFYLQRVGARLTGPEEAPGASSRASWHRSRRLDASTCLPPA